MRSTLKAGDPDVNTSRRYGHALLWQTVALISFFALQSCHMGAQNLEWLREHTPPKAGIWLESLGIQGIAQDMEKPRIGRTLLDHALTLHGLVYPHGIATHANSEWHIDLHGSAVRFVALVGVDDEVIPNGSVVFEVLVDGQRRAYSGVMLGGDIPQLFSVDLNGAKNLVLRVSDAGDGPDFDHADWADAALLLAPGAHTFPVSVPLSLSLPRARKALPETALNGPFLWFLPVILGCGAVLLLIVLFRPRPHQNR